MMNTRFNNKVPLLLLVIFLGLSCWSAINPHDTQVWWTEMSIALLLVGVLVATYRKFQFSNTAYCILAFWCYMQVVGAHYTFELVPFDFITNLFGFERNHYDRVAHFVVGMGGIAIAEILWRKRLVNTIATAAVFSVVFIMAIAGFWELVEWIYAEIDGGDAGQAFLGSQGDVWDAHKDMVQDTLGGILAAIIFYWQNRGQKAMP